jgi:multiple antibiotic resistance protein
MGSSTGAFLGLDFAITALVTLVVVVDPIGLAPTFLAVTHGLPEAAKRQVGIRASIIAAAILAGSALVGGWLLTRLGIGIPAFRIAGGLMLFSIASEMVFGVRGERQARTAEQAVEERVRNIAAFPLAIPVMAGPGAITATVLLGAKAGGDVMATALLLGTIVAVCIVCLAVYFAASRIGRWLGITGNVVLSRLLGVILAALAVQYVVDGVKTLLAS